MQWDKTHLESWQLLPVSTVKIIVCQVTEIQKKHLSRNCSKYPAPYIQMRGCQANQSQITKQRKIDVIFGYITKIVLMIVFIIQKIITEFI